MKTSKPCNCVRHRGTILPLTAFGVRKSRKDGRSTYCLETEKEANAIRHSRSRDRIEAAKAESKEQAKRVKKIEVVVLDKETAEVDRRNKLEAIKAFDLRRIKFMADDNRIGSGYVSIHEWAVKTLGVYSVADAADIYYSPVLNKRLEMQEIAILWEGQA